MGIKVEGERWGSSHCRLNRNQDVSSKRRRVSRNAKFRRWINGLPTYVCGQVRQRISPWAQRRHPEREIATVDGEGDRDVLSTG